MSSAVLTGSTVAIASDWESFGLQGMSVTSLAAAPGLLCAGTGSDDGAFCLDLTSPGAGWVPVGLTKGTIPALWIDPADQNVMFAAVFALKRNGPLLYRTVDGGATWRAADRGLAPVIRSVQGVPGTPIVYAAGNDGVYRSDDLGKKWSRLLSVGAVLSLAIAPTDPQTIWAGGTTFLQEGFTYVSINGGLSWRLVWDSYSLGPGPLGDNTNLSIAPHPAIDGLALLGIGGSVLRTDDLGLTLQQPPLADGFFYVDWDRGNSQCAYAAGSSVNPTNAFVSCDLGVTWASITGSLASHRVNDLVADDQSQGVVYAATNDGVYRLVGAGSPPQ